MRFERSRARNDEERILPLVNIVFLLLIFFMLAGRLSASDPFEIEPPRSRSEGPAGSQEMVVLLGADGRLALDGEETDRTALKSSVADRLSGNAEAEVRLKADGKAEATDVVAIMEVLREAGVETLELLTVPAGNDG